MNELQARHVATPNNPHQQQHPGNINGGRTDVGYPYNLSVESLVRSKLVIAGSDGHWDVPLYIHQGLYLLLELGIVQLCPENQQFISVKCGVASICTNQMQVVSYCACLFSAFSKPVRLVTCSSVLFYISGGPPERVGNSISSLHQ